MIITKVTRTYSKSINTRSISLNAPEAWIKLESVYEATCESGDDPFGVSKMLEQQAMKEVVEQGAMISDKIRASVAPVPVLPNGPMTETPANAAPRAL